MVEVPAAAIAVDLFDAAFFSIGSNDLTQYVTAAGRDIGDVAELADPLHPAVLRLIAPRRALTAGRSGRESACAATRAAIQRSFLTFSQQDCARCPSRRPRLARTKATIAGLTLS